MADTRINALSTATSSASDDFVPIDGTTNGTRKLSAYSPSFGGNATVGGTLTVNGSGTTAIGGMVKGAAATYSGNPPTGVTSAFQVDVENATTRDVLSFGDASRAGLLRGYHDGAGTINWRFGRYTASTFAEYVRIAGVAAADTVVSIYGTTASTSTSSGALVVSGGVGVAGALYAANLGGTSTNNNAASGCIGEYTSATTAYASKVSLTSNTAANIVSISLTAGDWDVQFNPVFTQDTPLTTSGLLAGVSSSSATLPSGAAERAHSPSGPNGNSDLSIAPPVTRISLASTTTIYGVATGIFSAGTMSAYGFIRARRVR